MCSTINIKDPTTLYRCRYTTLWNVRHRTQAGDDSDQLRDQPCSNRCPDILSPGHNSPFYSAGG